VILLVSPGQSLDRRGNVAERPRWQQWFDEGLLERLHTFYTDVAPALCPSPPLVIDTDGVSPDAVLAQVAALLGDAGLPGSHQRRPDAGRSNATRRRSSRGENTSGQR
jgi:hypothetical protein